LLDRGVDGFRLDVFNAFLKHPELLANPEIEGATLWARQHHLYDRDQPDFPDLIARFRSILDEQSGRMSVGELFASEAERAVMLSAERHMVFDWALLAAPWSAEAYRSAIWLRESMFGDDRWLANVLSNHDQSRQATRLAASAGIADTDAVARAAAVVLLTIRGTPFMYYGEEIGLRDIVVSDDEIIDPPARRALVDPDFQWWNRDGCRSPMQWTPEEPGHGFTTGRPWLPFGDDAVTRNVGNQADDPRSVLATYRRLIALRRESDALRTGTLRLIETPTPDVLAWRREVADERLVVVVNFANAPRETDLAAEGDVLRPLVGSHLDPPAPSDAGSLALRPLEAVVLRMG
jgi:alpha-glucosidase